MVATSRSRTLLKNLATSGPDIARIAQQQTNAPGLLERRRDHCGAIARSLRTEAMDSPVP
jgi:hypothetical protein